MSMPTIDTNIIHAAEAINQADGLIITAGAGMGVDSGLPDFRGKEGFWKAYPALARANMSFAQIACPDTFIHKPKLAWGFYGHRLNLYRKTQPHIGFRYLHAIAQQLEGGSFIFTSNVDGHFQKAGFALNNIVECHGSIHHLQCQNACNQQIWEATKYTPSIDEEHCLLTSAPPTCPSCGEIARPNIYMFGDWHWIEHRTKLQLARFYEWRYTVKNPLIIEMGAGKAIPTVREFGEELGKLFKIPMIRINPVDAKVYQGRDIALEMGALDGISAITMQLNAMCFFKKND